MTMEATERYYYSIDPGESKEVVEGAQDTLG